MVSSWKLPITDHLLQSFKRVYWVMYRFFIDGNLVGEIAEGNRYKNSNGTMLPVNGGKPIVTPQSISLCSRHDNDPQRHYDGLLAYLGKPHF